MSSSCACSENSCGREGPQRSGENNAALLIIQGNRVEGGLSPPPLSIPFLRRTWKVPTASSGFPVVFLGSGTLSSPDSLRTQGLKEPSPRGVSRALAEPGGAQGTGNGLAVWSQNKRGQAFVGAPPHTHTPRTELALRKRLSWEQVLHNKPCSSAMYN